MQGLRPRRVLSRGYDLWGFCPAGYDLGGLSSGLQPMGLVRRVGLDFLLSLLDSLLGRWWRPAFHINRIMLACVGTHNEGCGDYVDLSKPLSL